MTLQIPETEFFVAFQNDVPVICMPKRLTVLEAVAFKETCHQLWTQGSVKQKLILDFQKTEFLDSSGVGALVHNFKASQERKVDLILYHVRPPVMAVLSMTGLDEVLKITSLTQEEQHPSRVNPNERVPETHPSVRSWVKRFIDVVGSLVGLSITGILFAPLAIAILIDSPGPIFFSQTRCGWMGKRFKIVKFRSMCADAEALKKKIPNQAQGAIFKNQNDPRITKLGRFLRKTSLDELPQFWNVLMGDMSLVGTRPPTPDEVERYEVPEWQRLDVKPGMTGEWQVNGRSRVTNFEDVIKLDLRYQQNWSLGYDIQLIFKTITILFKKNSGAF
jgi:anti-anti-sigma factor